MKYFINLILIVSFVAYGMAAQVINPLEIQRTYGKDIRGYSQEEIDAAKKFLHETLYPERNKLIEEIKMLEVKKLQATDKGILWSNPKAESVDQYYTAYWQIKANKAGLKYYDEQIKNQEIIAGERPSALVRAGKYAVATAVITGILVAVGYHFDPYLFDTMEKKYYQIRDDLEYRLFGGESPIHSAGGLLPYVRNRIFGEPYIIEPVSNLEFYNPITKKWEPAESNVQLARQLPLKDISGAKTSEWTEFSTDLMTPIRWDFYIWDEKIGAYRRAVGEEKSLQSILNRTENIRLEAKKIREQAETTHNPTE